MTDPILALLPVKLEYALLFFTRVTALVSTAPFFTAAPPWSAYRVAISVASTMVLLPALGDREWEGPGLGVGLVPLLARELLTGALLGWIVSAAFAALRAAGELVGSEMGLNLASILDPVTGAGSTVVTTLFQVLAGLTFVSLGAHRWVIVALARSFRRIPVGTLELGPDPATGIVLLTGRLLEGGLVLAAPIMAAMFLVTVVLGVVSRAVPQLNILDTGYALRVTAAVGALALLLPALRHGIEPLFETMRLALLEAIPATRP